MLRLPQCQAQSTHRSESYGHTIATDVRHRGIYAYQLHCRICAHLKCSNLTDRSFHREESGHTLSGTFIQSCPGSNPRVTTQFIFRVCLIPRGQCIRTSPKLENGHKYTDTNTLCLSLQSWHIKTIFCRNAHATTSPLLSYQPPCKLPRAKSTQMKLLACTIIMCNDKSRWTVAFHTFPLTQASTRIPQ